MKASLCIVPLFSQSSLQDISDHLNNMQGITIKDQSINQSLKLLQNVQYSVFPLFNSHFL